MTHRLQISANRLIHYRVRKPHERATLREAAVGAAAVKDLYEKTLADAGTTKLTPYKPQPLIPSAIHQWIGAENAQGATCWILAILLYLSYFAPTYLENLIVPVDAQNVIVLMTWQGQIVAVHVTLDIPTSFNEPSNGDLAPMIVLMAVALLNQANWQTATAGDMTHDDVGDPAVIALALGLNVSGLVVSPASFTAALAVSGQGIIALTPASPPGGFIGDHAYLFRAMAGANFTAQQPQQGGVDVTVTPAQLILQNFQSAITVSIPATPKLTPALVAGEVPAAPTLITGPVVPVGGGKTYQRPDLAALFHGGTQGFAPTDGVWGDASIGLPDTGTNDVTVTVDEKTAKLALNGTVGVAVGGIITWEGVTGPYTITSGGGGGDVESVAITPTNAAPAPRTITGIAAVITLSDSTTESLAASSITSTAGKVLTVGGAA